MINILKLTSGEEIICNIKDQNSSELVVDLPVRIMSQVNVSSEEYLFVLVDWVPFSHNSWVTISTNAVVTQYTPTGKIIEEYKERVLEIAGEQAVANLDNEKEKYSTGLH